MPKPITKAIFPVAGLGTRFLPATKSIPNEIMTLIDRPLIQYAIDEAREAGIEEFIFVTSRGKSALEDYFDESPYLRAELERKGKAQLLGILDRTEMPSGAIAYVRQTQALGLGHAVWCARRLVGNEPVAVLLPDDVIAGSTGCLKQMVDVYQNTGGSMVAAMRVTAEAAPSYGILDIAEDMGGRLLPVKGMVEKPEMGTAPSDLAIIGRYILAPEVFASLGNTSIGIGGEIQLTDAIAAQIDKAGVYGFRFEGQRFDCGSKAGFLQATVSFALEREELRKEMASFLRALPTDQTAAA